MSRAQRVQKEPGLVVRHQDFENWPDGVASHATAPMDYLIVGLEGVLRRIWPEEGRVAGLRESTLDLAGALISPLLGIVLCSFLAAWSVGLHGSPCAGRRVWWMVPLLAAVSPPMVHATILARPDHQSLLLLLLAIALGAEQRLQKSASPGWAWAGGLAWGAALWVSLYEPAVLLGVVLLLGLWPWRASWNMESRLRWTLGLLIPVACGWMIDGIHLVLPDPQWTEVLKRWGATIGELQGLEGTGAFSAWVGLLAWIVPALLLMLAIRKGAHAWGWLLLLLSVAALAIWQVRWSPYCVLVFILCLPLLDAFERPPAHMGLAFILSLWPVFVDWEQRLHPDATTSEQRYMERSERINARLAAQRMRSPERQPFLAVWWHSPALAYWSGQPAVSGSGHEGISGIVDSARFFLAADPNEAREILARRGVSIVVASDSARAVENSAAVLGKNVTGKPLAERLWGGSESLKDWSLEGETNVTMFRLLRVDQTVR